MSRRICVYCAANDKVDKKYKEKAYELGEEIAKSGDVLIYGGGNSGLMGAVANGCVDCGGYVVSVAPDFMSEFEPIFDDNKNVQVIHIRSMATRKEIMEHNADLFVIMPGGIGTFDEFFQILTQRELRREEKPIILYNVFGFYDDLIAFVDKCISMNFIREKVRGMFKICNTIEEVMSSIQEVK